MYLIQIHFLVFVTNTRKCICYKYMEMYLLQIHFLVFLIQIQGNVFVTNTFPCIFDTNTFACICYKYISLYVLYTNTFPCICYKNISLYLLQIHFLVFLLQIQGNVFVYKYKEMYL